MEGGRGAKVLESKISLNRAPDDQLFVMYKVYICKKSTWYPKYKKIHLYPRYSINSSLEKILSTFSLNSIIYFLE